MAQTKEGAKKAVFSIKERHGDDYFKVIGAKGGKASGTGGFYANRELARTAGAIGGRVSRRTKQEKLNKENEVQK
jgi:general stress protein YciG